MGKLIGKKKVALASTEAGSRETHPFPKINRFLVDFCLLNFLHGSIEFSFTLFIAEISSNSLFFVALAGLLISLVVAFGQSVADKWIGKMDRLVAMTRLLVGSIVSVIVITIVCIVLLLSTYFTGPSTTRLMYILPFLFATTTLCAASIRRVIENDWIVVLSDQDSEWLTKTNSRMQQGYLFGSSISPVVVGMLCSTLPLGMVAVLLVVGHIGTMLFLLTDFNTVYNSFPPLASRSIEGAATTAVDGTGKGTNMGVNSSMGAPASAADEKMRALAAVLGNFDDDAPSSSHIQTSTTTAASTSSSCMARSIASCRAVCSTGTLRLIQTSGCVSIILASCLVALSVLSFGPVTTVYLRSTGMSDHSLGILRGLAAVAGGAGGMLFAPLKERVGVVVAGRYGVWFQATCVGVAALCVSVLSPAGGSGLVALAVLVSRVGWWLFELCTRDIVATQTMALPEEVRKEVNGYRQTLTSLFAAASFAAAVALPDQASFSILATSSAIASVCGCAVYTVCSPDVHAWLRLVCCKVCQGGEEKSNSGPSPAKRANAASRSDFTALSTSSHHGLSEQKGTSTSMSNVGDDDDDDIDLEALAAANAVTFTIVGDDEDN
jgi:hypothetical protein